MPQPRLLLKPGKHNNWSSERLTAELSFDYDGSVVPHQHRGGGFYQKEQRRLVTRDLAAEDKALVRLKQLGIRKGWESERADLQLAPDQLARVVRVLSGESWHIEAQGSLYRTAGGLTMQVNSGVDWFGVDGAAAFGDTRVGLPRLLRAIKQGEQTVRLDDGSLGIIPEEWMKKYGMLAGLGTFEGDGMHFKRSKPACSMRFGDEPAVSFDAVFERVRRELRDFSGVAAVAPAGEFHGELRALSARRLGLAALSAAFRLRRLPGRRHGPGQNRSGAGPARSAPASCAATTRKARRRRLVVVPRSLMFQLETGGGALHARAEHSRPHRRRAAASRASISTTTTWS